MSDMAPMTQEQLDVEAHWQMPEIKVGMQIVWHPNWNDKAKVINGFVTRVSMRSIECMTQNGENQLLVRDVLHMADPRLERNQYMQRNGSWEYSDIELRLQAMEKRLLALECIIGMRSTGLTEIMYGSPSSAEVAIEEAPHVSVATPLPKVKKERKQMSEEAKRLSVERLRAYHAKRREEKLQAKEAASQ